MTFNETVTLVGLGVAGVIGLVLLIVLAVGLFQARSLVRRELSAYFVSPIAYVIIVGFLLVTGVVFYRTLEQLTTSGPEGVEYPMRSMFGDHLFWLVFLFIPPLLTMRSFAEERSSGTLEMLMTAPLRDWQLVLSKFAGCFLFYIILWIPTLVYLPILLDLKVQSVQWVMTPWSLLFAGGIVAAIVGLVLLFPRVGTELRLLSVLLVLGGIAAAVTGGLLHYRHDSTHLIDVSAGIDPAPMLTLYLGMMLAGAMFLAIGLFVSSLVRDQLVSAIIAILISLVFVGPVFLKIDMDTGSLFSRVVYFFTVPMHFSNNFSRGLLDTRPLILYSSVALVLLFFTVRSLESRRWR
jgi:ABC-type transport system involved in multi-copper enzyme maturation permease subunit